MRKRTAERGLPLIAALGVNTSMIWFISVLGMFFGSVAITETSPISPDDRIVIRATISGCPDFPGVLALRNLSENPKLSVLGLPPLEIIGFTEIEASELLVEAISQASVTGHRPRSIVVEKIKSDEEYQSARETLYLSVHYLRTNDCVRKVPKQDESDPGLLETMKSIALTPNKAMERR